MKRESGYYWVKYGGGLWEIGHYNFFPYSGKAWCIMYLDEHLQDNEFDEINEERILPPNN